MLPAIKDYLKWGSDLKAREVPFALASAYQRPEQFGGDALTGAPNIGKPVKEHRLLAALWQLTEL